MKKFFVFALLTVALITAACDISISFPFGDDGTAGIYVLDNPDMNIFYLEERITVINSSLFFYGNEPVQLDSSRIWEYSEHEFYVTISSDAVVLKEQSLGVEITYTKSEI